MAATFTDPRHAASTMQAPILVGDQQVGRLYVKFNGRGLVESADSLRRSLLQADVAAAGVAAVSALVAAVIVARRLSAPVRTLTAAAGAMSRGNRQVPVGELAKAPAELSELAATFDRMAATISHEERLRRDLVADVAHELRTPVAVLQANCEALLDGVVPHTPAQTASLHEEVLRLAAMVDDLQTLASAEAAALHLVRETCDLATVAEMAIDAMHAKASAANVHLSHELTSGVMEGDPTRLHQIVTNLLSNAVKFTPAGGTVHVLVTPDTRTARLVVADTGQGIDAEELPHVFDRFWRGQQATEATEGTGIGLSIVAELITAHGGDINIDSRPGEGTTVTVTFPLAPVAN